MSEAVVDEPCRVDVWLWRARFFKTRGLAAKFAEGKRIRRFRPGQEEARLDKASRTVRVGDRLVFAIGGKVFDLLIADCGTRRGPAAEAQTLYHASDSPC
jgi:ribosome-associated heat shock protein Hsp15